MNAAHASLQPSSAAAHLAALKDNPYPGRGIVQGLAPSGKEVLQVYWIMGRSVPSRQRIFEVRGELLRVIAADTPSMLGVGESGATQKGNPALLHYTAMQREGMYHLVSNGDHTEQLALGLRAQQSLQQAFCGCSYEPDPPHHTPRIAAAFDMSNRAGWMGIAKIDPSNERSTLRQHFEQEALPIGMGWCITTYMNNAEPLPAFCGEPYLLPFKDTAQETLTLLWEHLDPNHRVAMAVRSIAVSDGAVTLCVVNTHQ